MIILTPDWHILALKDPDVRTGNDGFPLVGEGVTICGKPHLLLVLLISVIEASPFSQEAWILGKININIIQVWETAALTSSVRVAKCQIFYTDQFFPTEFTPRKSA